MAVELVVQADDLGASPAITDGILRCFAAGVVTQASVLVPAPDAGRAMWLARRGGMPVGVHLALISEWPGLRWGPLTAGDSLRAPDGGFWEDLPSLRAHASAAEAEAELHAQVAAVRLAGLRPRHCESHVRVFDAAILARVSARHALPCRDPVPALGLVMDVDSVWHLSVQPPQAKLDALVGHVRGLPPGRHMIVAHPADDGPELRRLCPPTSPRWPWARDIRIGDAEALLHPRFTEACAEQGLRLVDLPPHRDAGRPGGADAAGGAEPGAQARRRTHVCRSDVGPGAASP